MATKIATRQLVDGENWIKRDGSVAMTGVLNMNSQRIANLFAPSAGSDAATKDYVDTAVAGVSSANFVDKEIPTGAIDSTNTSFVLANTPIAGSEHVYLNGVLQEAGTGNDYTISAATLVFAVAPLTGEKIRVSYRR